MKVLLMYRDRDFDVREALPRSAPDLIRDLELETLFRGADPFLTDVFKRALLASLHDPPAILYRQGILADCIEQPAIVREIYAIAVEALESEKRVWRVFGMYPEGVLHRSIDVMKMFAGLLRRLRQLADEHRGGFRSKGFIGFFAMLAEELSDEYLATVEEHLRRLEFRRGILMTAQPGKGFKATNYVLHSPKQTVATWLDRVQSWVGERLTSRSPESYVYEIADRDESGFNALSELRGHGIAHVAAALARSTDHIQGFFGALRTELAFYIACLDLRDRLTSKAEPVCLPEPAPPEDRTLIARGLYDPCLSLTIESRAVGNDVSGEGAVLMIVTGANRGGKSTFLRSVGVAQLMMQCGMFVAAEFFRSDVSRGVYTHFKREEDPTMKSGKLDEELARMSLIVDSIMPGGLVLCNESFASTNEREGSEIASQIVRAFLECGVKVFYVTHMYDLAQRFYRQQKQGALFLRAERLPDGQRTFRVREGEPLPTSYGSDLYTRIFGEYAGSYEGRSGPTSV